MLAIKEHSKVNDNEFSNIIDDYLKYNKFERDEIKLGSENGEK